MRDLRVFIQQWWQMEKSEQIEKPRDFDVEATHCRKAKFIKIRQPYVLVSYRNKQYSGGTHF